MNMSEGDIGCVNTSGGSANYQPVDLERWLADTYRYALPGFSARRATIIQSQVIANHANDLEGVRSRPGQSSAFDRSCDPAVLDEEGKLALERELSTDDVDLPAAQVSKIEASLDRADDFLGAKFAIEHEGVGHARHRQVRIGFPSCVAGAGMAHQAGVKAVVHIAFENAVLDQCGALAWFTLIVDMKRSATSH